ncbi:MAG: hypothetical protein SPI77_09305 [Corynebacterium sp.]|nr:hypothetical protein [Corynebacterium sp.]
MIGPLPLLLSAAALHTTVTPARRLATLCPVRKESVLSTHRTGLIVGVCAGCGGAGLIVAPWAVAVAVGILAATGVVLGGEWRTYTRHRADRKALVSVYESLEGSLRAGALMDNACAEAARACPRYAPALDAARRVGATAFDHRSGLTDLQKLWTMATVHGIPLGRLLGIARNAVISELGHEAETLATLQGALTTAVILAVLPILGVGLGATMGASSVSFLVTSGLGGIVLISGAGLMAAGCLWSARIITGALA